MTEEDQTIMPQRQQAGNFGLEWELEKTMPGRRDRKAEGRFETGDLIMKRYKVLAELGQGGMGVVYKCFDETAGVEVALKALPPELSHSTDEMEDIRDNFQLVAKLVHQNIAISKNLERNPENGNYYLIMECCEGEDLRRWLRRKRKEGPLTPEIVLPIVKQVALALDYAHKQRVMHRDIKPGNIMIDQEGTVKILDFGLAAQIHTSMTRVSLQYHGTSGTGPYMAPEQWQGHPQGAPADQYALAVMTYEMLAGHLPFENSDAAILREAVLKGTPLPIPGVPVTIQTAIFRAMSKESAERFPNCADFIAAMEGTEPEANLPAQEAGPTPDAEQKPEQKPEPVSVPKGTRKSGKLKKFLIVFLILAALGGAGTYLYMEGYLDDAIEQVEDWVKEYKQAQLQNKLDSINEELKKGNLEEAKKLLDEVRNNFSDVGSVKQERKIRSLETEWEEAMENRKDQQFRDSLSAIDVDLNAQKFAVAKEKLSGLSSMDTRGKFSQEIRQLEIKLEKGLAECAAQQQEFQSLLSDCERCMSYDLSTAEDKLKEAKNHPGRKHVEDAQKRIEELTKTLAEKKNEKEKQTFLDLLNDCERCMSYDLSTAEDKLKEAKNHPGRNLLSGAEKAEADQKIAELENKLKKAGIESEKQAFLDLLNDCERCMSYDLSTAEDKLNEAKNHPGGKHVEDAQKRIGELTKTLAAKKNEKEKQDKMEKINAHCKQVTQIFSDWCAVEASTIVSEYGTVLDNMEENLRNARNLWRELKSFGIAKENDAQDQTLKALESDLRELRTFFSKVSSEINAEEWSAAYATLTEATAFRNTSIRNTFSRYKAILSRHVSTWKNWKPGSKHPNEPRVTAGDKPGVWIAPVGYEFKNNKLVWKTGMVHPEHPHVIADEDEDDWRAADGYEFTNDRWLNGVQETDQDLSVKWDPDWDTDTKRATETEGVFEYKRTCTGYGCKNGKVSKTITCRRCNGEKQIICPICNGNGTYRLPLTDRTLQCTNCSPRNNRMVRCTFSILAGCGCNGTGQETIKVDCSRCDGDGYVWEK